MKKIYKFTSTVILHQNNSRVKEKGEKVVVTDLSSSFHPVPKMKVEKKKKTRQIRQRSAELANLERKRFSILANSDDYCFLCGRHLNKYEDNKHEIFFGNGKRRQSMKHGLVVPLCNKCHTKGNLAVHNNYFVDLKLKQ